MQKTVHGKIHAIPVKSAIPKRGRLASSPHTLDLKSTRAETVAKAARTTAPRLSGSHLRLGLSPQGSREHAM